MPDEHIDLTAFRKIRDQYAADLEKAEKDMDKAKEKVAFTKNHLQIANDMIAEATGGKEGITKPLGEEIVRILTESDAALTARDMRDRFLSEGFSFELAAIHVTAERLRKKGAIEMSQSTDGRTKLFKKNAAATAAVAKNGGQPPT